MSKISLFCSAAGGVGKSTLALLSTQCLKDKKVLLVDFTLHGGIEAILRKSKRKCGINYLMDEYSDSEKSLDIAIIADETLGCDILFNANPLQMDKMSHTFVDKLIEAVAVRHYDHIIFDTSFELSEKNARLFQIADQLNFILTQDITVFWRTIKFFEILDKLMIDRKKIRMILNQYRKSININVSEFEEEANLSFTTIIKYYKHDLINHTNSGKLYTHKTLNKQLKKLWEAL